MRRDILCIMRIARECVVAVCTFRVPNPCGAIAQLGERIVRNDEVVGSIPTSSTIFSITCSEGDANRAHALRHIEII